jgi:hypothetical protein
VNVEHRVQLIDGHLVERDVAPGSRVVHDRVDGAEGIDRAFDDRLAALGRRHGVVRRDGGARARLDLGHDRVGGRPAPVVQSPDVVHHDCRAAATELERIRATEPLPRARDDHNLSVEVDGHGAQACTRDFRACQQKSRVTSVTR